MQYRLFMENATDDFHSVIEPQGPVRGPVMRWFEVKPTAMPNAIPTNKYSDSSGGVEVIHNLSVRKEPWGVILLNRFTGKVYELDNQAADSLVLLMEDCSPAAIASELNCEINKIEEFSKYCLENKILIKEGALAPA